MSEIKILIVDDEEVLCNVLGDTLERLGFNVTKFYDGQSALDCLRDNDFDIAILDLFLPLKNGMDILKYIKTNKSNIDVIMATGYSEVSTAHQAIELGASDFLVKPYEIKKLKDSIDKVLEKRKDIKEIKNNSNINIPTEPKIAKVDLSDKNPNIESIAPSSDEKNKIESALKSVGWNKSKTAEILGIPLKTLFSKIKEYDLKP